MRFAGGAVFLVAMAVPLDPAVAVTISETLQDSQSSTSITRAQVEIDKQKGRLASGDPEERRDALMRLGLLKRVEASRAALPALADPLPMIRVTAANAVSALPPGEGAAALIPLLSDKDEFVRQQVCYALGQMQNSMAVAALVERLNSGKLASVRGAAAVALGQIGDESAVVALAGALAPAAQAGKKRKAINDEFVLRAAARSLGEIGSRAGCPVLLEALTNASMEIDVRREAARALGRIGDPAAIPALQTAMGATDVYLSQLARESLSKISAKSAKAPS